MAKRSTRVLITVFISALAFFTAPAAASASPPGSPPPARVLLAVEGMHCGGCAAAVKSALKKTEGVIDYEVSVEKKEADVNFDPAKTDPEKIAAEVSKTGFKATVKSKGSGTGKGE